MKNPTVGDTLWYQPSETHPNGPGGQLMITNRKPCPAVVDRVFTERLVNLRVTDEDGAEHEVRFVTLVHPNDPHPRAHVGHCQWEQPELEASPTIAADPARETQSIGAAEVGSVESVLGITPKTSKPRRGS